MIKLPKDFIAADYKFDFAIPIAKLETVKTSEGFEFRVVYEANEIQEFAQHAAHEMNEKVEAAIMDELLRLNERTCQMEYDEKEHGVYCSHCGERMDTYTCEWDFVTSDPYEYSYPFCYNCGAKVVE